MGSALFGGKFPNEVIALRVEFYKVLCIDHGVMTIVLAVLIMVSKFAIDFLAEQQLVTH